MENQTAVIGFRVPSRRRSNCFPDAAWTAEFVREYFADAGTDFSANLRTNLLEQACPILARDKLAAENEEVKPASLWITCTSCQTHKELWLLIQNGERFQSEVPSPRRIAVMCVEVYRGPSLPSVCVCWIESNRCQRLRSSSHRIPSPLDPLFHVSAESFFELRFPIFVAKQHQEKVDRILVHHVGADCKPLSRREDDAGFFCVTDNDTIG